MKLISFTALVAFFWSAHLAAQSELTFGASGRETIKKIESPIVETPCIEAGTSDLLITSLVVSNIIRDHRSGTVVLIREISYTIKNVGTSDVSLKNVKVQGYLGYDDVYIIKDMVPACGESISIVDFKLVPGASFSKKYKCTVDSKWSGMIFYLLRVDALNIVRELDENNNTIVTAIN